MLTPPAHQVQAALVGSEVEAVVVLVGAAVEEAAEEAPGDPPWLSSARMAGHWAKSRSFL
jgi:hypothetical protein